VQWLARWTSDLKVSGSRPGLCHRVVSLDKIVNSSLSSSYQGVIMGSDDIKLGETSDGRAMTGIPLRGD